MHLNFFHWLVIIFLSQGTLLSDFTYSQSNSSRLDNQSVVPDKTKEMLKEIYEGDAFRVKSFQAHWLPDGSAYLALEETPGTNFRLLVSYNADGGNRTELISPDKLAIPGYTDQSKIENYTFLRMGKRSFFGLPTLEMKMMIPLRLLVA